jgi:predicted dehydrogenase
MLMTSPVRRHQRSASRAALRYGVLLFAIGCAAAWSDVRPPLEGSAPQTQAWATRDLRAGIIGTDTSHVPQFTAIFQSHPEWRIKVVAAYKGGSPDLPISANRLEGFAKTIQEKHGVEIVDTIDALLARVDVVLLESVDGRPHLAQVTPVLKAGKRVFIDKPLAASLDDARAILRLSNETRTPFFSSSSYRFHPDIPRLRDNPGVGKVTTIQTSSPFNVMEHHPDLYYYGIHGVEALYAVMGGGCVSVSRKIGVDADVTTGKWKDGRIGVYYGPLKSADKQPVVRIQGDKGSTETSASAAYDGLAIEIAQFFHTGRSPVDSAETIEIFEFMSAAQLSKERGGAEISLAELRK